MVRKRAQAQKALSPPRESSNKRAGRRSSESKNANNIVDEIPQKKAKIEDEKELKNDNKVEEIIEAKKMNKNGMKESETENDIREQIANDIKQDGIETNFDDLPDYETFSKELGDKAKTYWESVKLDYNDFSNWTCLLQSVTETEENIEAARASYNCFLRYYPYCYGYWKKFADIERKSGNIAEARNVFDRGIKAIPISIDLWVHYLNFSIQQNKGKDNQKEIREIFNRAIDAAGMEFKSNKLWDAYIEWEKSLGNLKNVTEIFDRLIATPTQQYIKNWQKFKVHLESYSPTEVIPAKEYGKLMKEIDAIPPGMVDNEDIPGEGDELKVSSIEDTIGVEGMKETYRKMRKIVLKERESMFLKTTSEIKKRLRYEEAIKRPYFHVKPLEKPQIKNWREYLDYELNQGGHKRIVFLFERCMVVCALYDTFWEKYLDYIETKDAAIARTVFYRACNIHQRKKYKIHLRWATFEERQNNYNSAALILSRIDTNFPGMILITQKRVGVARRMNRLNDIVSIYESAIDNSERIEDKIFYSIKFSHVLAKSCNKKAQGREVLWSALQLGKKHKRIYLQLLDLEIHYGSFESHFVNKLFNSVQYDRSVDDEFRESFAQRKVEFYEEYGNDIDEIIAVQNAYTEEHKKNWFKRKLSESSSRETPSKSTRKDSTDGRADKNKSNSRKASASSSDQIAAAATVPQGWFPPPPDAGNYYGGWQQNYGQYQQQQ